MKILERIYPHAIAVFGFILISLLFFYPVLQGKKIAQSDIVQYSGMAKEQNDFRATENKEPYWTNSAFGGMPTYQLGANYPHEYINKFDAALRFLPRPSDYLFLYFLSFYVLLLVLKADTLKAFFGALAFGFSTYLIIILGVGHNAKAHAIAYMPLVVAGVLMVFQRRFLVGGLLTMIAAALELNANHFQMTYYLLFLILIITCFYIYNYAKEKDFKTLLTSFGVFAIAGILAIGANATSILATKEYTDFSIRGKSELTFDSSGNKKTENTALSKSYITEYSYGISESFNLIAPRLFGGGNGEKLNEDSSVYNFMLQNGASPEVALQYTEGYGKTYWGKQPIVEAPAYIGAVIFFLSILGLFHDKRKLKYAFWLGILFSLALSWGKNLSLVTNFFIDFIPFYDKFRAVSSIQVILELCFPVLAIMGLQSFFNYDKEKQWSSLWKASITVFGLFICLFVMKSTFDFCGQQDQQLLQIFSQGQDKAFGVSFIEALVQDRKSLYVADLMRSAFFVLLATVALYLYSKNKLGTTAAVISVSFFMIADLFFVDKNYVNANDFVNAREVDVPFIASPTDEQIMQDTTQFRVLDIQGYLSAKASYFHKSIGGYSAVRPKRMQELFDYQIVNSNMEVLNMLNVKYIFQTNEKDEEFAIKNPNVNGNVWFVQKVKFVNSPDEEMKALDSLDTKDGAIVNQKEFGTQLKNTTFVKDSLATITMNSYKPNHLKYTSNNQNSGLAVFSEMYYADGWNAFIDGKAVSHFRADYALRAMEIPAGKHSIEFKFEPQVVKIGSTIALISSILMLLLLIGGVYFEQKKSKKYIK
ncbi:MAG: hypothetical protein EXR18_07710 [Flavobacteriaceae bacterium]|nr:hypothetical protein [Flavobacteriaceae bacterium]